MSCLISLFAWFVSRESGFDSKFCHVECIENEYLLLPCQIRLA